MKTEDIEMMRKCLLAASPHYPGFEQEAMQRNINELCNMAQHSLAAKDAYNRVRDSIVVCQPETRSDFVLRKLDPILREVND